MFFDSTPNFLYPDFTTPGRVKLSKNIFRRVRIRDSFNAIYASSRPYTIIGGETPDSIAYDKLGGSEWYWTILLLNNIHDTCKQWPMADLELDQYIDSKYGDQADKPRHWETIEIKDSAGNVVLPNGTIVEQYTNSTAQNATGYVPQVKNPEGGKVLNVSIVSGTGRYASSNGVSTITQSGGGSGLTLDIVSNGSTITSAAVRNPGLNYKVGDVVKVYGGNATVRVTGLSTPIWTNWFFTYTKSYDPIATETATAANNLIMITNREYEYQLNDLKKSIYLPTPSVLPVMRSELEELLEYDTTYKITRQGYRESE